MMLLVIEIQPDRDGADQAQDPDPERHLSRTRSDSGLARRTGSNLHYGLVPRAPAFRAEARRAQAGVAGVARIRTKTDEDVSPTATN